MGLEQDLTRPNPGRIYDYLLGGTHNFPVDRAVADQLVQYMPLIPRWMRLNRWYLHRAVAELAASNFSCYIDLATGIPTQGYLHEQVPSSTRIIYNDHDPMTVAYGQQILGDQPNIRYVQSDLREIDTLLNEAESFFGGERRVGISMVGVAYFIDDAALRNVLDRLHAWAAPGSRLAMTLFQVEQAIPADDPALNLYRQMGSEMFMRTAEQIADVTADWRVSGPGLEPLEVLFQDRINTPPELAAIAKALTIVGGIFER